MPAGTPRTRGRASISLQQQLQQCDNDAASADEEGEAELEQVMSAEEALKQQAESQIPEAAQALLAMDQVAE